MENKKLYTISIKNWEEPIIGIIEDSSKKWILIKRIAVDYMFDGFSLIQKCHIKSCKRTKNNQFAEKVLAAKGVMDIITPQIQLDNRLDPLKWLYSQQKVVELWTAKESFVAQIKEVRTNILHWMSMSSRGEWKVDSYYTMKINNIISIDIDTDYIISLLIYNKSKL